MSSTSQRKLISAKSVEIFLSDDTDWPGDKIQDSVKAIWYEIKPEGEQSTGDIVFYSTEDLLLERGGFREFLGKSRRLSVCREDGFVFFSQVVTFDDFCTSSINLAEGVAEVAVGFTFSKPERINKHD